MAWGPRETGKGAELSNLCFLPMSVSMTASKIPQYRCTGTMLESHAPVLLLLLCSQCRDLQHPLLLFHN